MALGCVRLALGELGHLAMLDPAKGHRHDLSEWLTKFVNTTQAKDYEHLPANAHMPTLHHMTGSVTAHGQGASDPVGTLRALVPFTMQNWKACNDCHGTGIGREFARLEGGEFGWKPAPCKSCCEIGALPAPDFAEILSDIIAHTGKNKGQILRSFNGKRLDRWAKEWDVRTRAHRAYYVWRLYQFHAGIDVRMPVSAEWGYTDPYKGELDMFARILVQRIRGHESAGVARWRGAFFGEDASAGLPESAYTGGPERMG